MSERSIDDLLADLDKAITQLSDGSAPLEELVAAHQRAVQLRAEAEVLLGELKSRADETSQLLTQ